MNKDHKDLTVEERFDKIVELLLSLTDDERLDVFSDFCTHCGTETISKNCHCWNEE